MTEVSQFNRLPGQWAGPMLLPNKDAQSSYDSWLGCVVSVIVVFIVEEARRPSEHLALLQPAESSLFHLLADALSCKAPSKTALLFFDVVKDWVSMCRLTRGRPAELLAWVVPCRAAAKFLAWQVAVSGPPQRSTDADVEL